MLSMSDVTRILTAIEAGDTAATDELLPLVYSELRRLAEAKLFGERDAHSVQPTMLVHDAYLRLVDVAEPQKWNGRGHFFAAAAEAMRRILVENARRKRAIKNGGMIQRADWDSVAPEAPARSVDLLALDEALDQLAERWPKKAELVKLRYFAGLTIQEAAKDLGVSRATAERHWAFSRAWLFARIGDNSETT